MKALPHWLWAKVIGIIFHNEKAVRPNVLNDKHDKSQSPEIVTEISESCFFRKDIF